MTVVETADVGDRGFLFNVIGAIMFVWHVGRPGNVGWQLAGALLFSMPVIGALIAVQRMGFFGLLSKIFNLKFRK